jgi:purine-binding chemotaxis protein CheW
MHPATRLVVFELEDRRYGLPLDAVDGVVNVQGRVIPVANVRKRFGFSEREPRLSDQLIVARTPRRPVALVVDAVSAVAEYAH